MSPIFLQLETNDGKLHTVDSALVKEMDTICQMLMLECSGKSEVIPLPRIDSRTLKLLLKWCKYMNGCSDNTDVSVRLNILKRLIQKAGGEDEILFQMINAANYLQMERLLDTGTQLVANIIQSYDSVEELRVRFHIESDEE
ncbi:E3 ubiquitin ligase complex SCF subunit sconC [Drosophila serrata]|uniref:E3 ubiquitin ligase complex SCF subunit sconC n=1 Tax=Drosophila serrata TaxID=7274 RepID=UPI000A1D2C98|nr:E3 ubiquitin ligase complex SCF subunit sconC [Drosophila serrata]